jgi:hypothetical protein
MPTVKNPNDMRREMQRISATGMMEDGEPSAILASIVRTCLQAGRYEGWSGEDTYTVLAWQLLNTGKRLERAVMDEAVMRPPASVRRIMAPPNTWLAMDIAPKDRVILLCMPEMGGAWAAGPWRGGWGHTDDCWTLHLPYFSDGKASVVSLRGTGLEPTGWMEAPRANQT